MQRSPWTSAGAYLFAALLFFWPYADLLSNAWPPQLGSLEWRYGFAGLLAAYHHTPILGLLLASGVAFWQGHRRALRAISTVALMGTLVLVLVAGAFVLDLLQVRASRPEEVRAAVLVGGVIAVLKHLSAAAVLGLLGVGGWKSTAKSNEATQNPPRVGVVMKR